MRTLLWNNDWVLLLKMYHDMDVSQQFLDCLDAQLTVQFIAGTNIKLERLKRLRWPQETKPELKMGKVSTILASISVMYGSVTVTIAWKAKSGRIYQMHDSDIDCDDLEFWFEGLDVEKLRYLDKPDFSKFFAFPEMFLKPEFFAKMSPAFVNCKRKQLSRDFEAKTGLKINRHIGLYYTEFSFRYTKDVVSRVRSKLDVNHNTNDNVYVCWKSKSGRIYDMADEDFDCNDVEMWLEGLDPLLYHRQLSPKDPLPFKLKDLSYKLTVNRIQTDIEITLLLKPEEVPRAEGLLEDIYDFIEAYNDASEKKDFKDGVVHNAWGSISDSTITLNVDIGSVGAGFFKRMFRHLSQLNAFMEVTVD